MLRPLVLLLRWSRNGLGTVAGHPTGQRGALDIGGALVLVAAITLVAILGMPTVLTLGGGVGLSVLFVVARSWIVVQERSSA